MMSAKDSYSSEDKKTSELRYVLQYGPDNEASN